MKFRRFAHLLAATLALFALAPASSAAVSVDAGADAECVTEDGGACPVDLDDLGDEEAPGDAGIGPAAHLIFFWGVGCPSCEEAKPFLDRLGAEFPSLVIERVEVRQDPEGRRRFLSTMSGLGAEVVGVPTFVVNGAYLVGYSEGSSDERVRRLVRNALAGEVPQNESLRQVQLPGFGSVDPTALSLPAFTLLVGLVDGVNPCAMWVLLVLLGILVHVKSRGRLLLFGGTFVVMSGVVYFVFMTAWVQLFALLGLSRLVTIALGAVVVMMGLVNLKELLWFKKGVSLVIPEKAKPTLYRRMRGIARSASLPAAFVGIAVLAFFVNLVELGCTLGLPAVYTRILTLRDDLSEPARYAYLALYNVAYIVPLALIVVVYALTLHRITLGERGAKVLKGVSGVLLVAFGALFLFAPDLLG